MSGQADTHRPALDEDYYRLLCEHVGLAIIATDTDARIRMWNTAAGRLLGAKAGPMIGTPIVSVVPQEIRETLGRVVGRAIEHGESSEFEFEYRDTQGKRRELAASVAPIVTESGARLGASACLRDITRRITLKAELAQRRKMASLGEMAGAVAHHFNNILGGIITSLDYAAASDYPAVQKRAIDQAGRGLARATALVNNLLAFAEGDQRTDDLADFTEIISGIVDELEQAVDSNRITLHLEMAKLPVISVPRVQVTTILRNVTQNAIDAMPDGGALRIAVSIEGDNVVTRVTDTGCGFDEDTLGRIFEPFWSTKGDLSSGPGKAVGMGLSVAHGATQALGGSISAASTVNEGSCFTIKIPTTWSGAP